MTIKQKRQQIAKPISNRIHFIHITFCVFFSHIFYMRRSDVFLHRNLSI